MKNRASAFSAILRSLFLGRPPARSGRRRGFQPGHLVEVCESRELLAADFTVQFGQVFAGQADNPVTVDLTNAPASGGTLNAWIDFDGDGQYHGANEKIFSGFALSQGSNSLHFEVPFSAIAGDYDSQFMVETSDPAQSTINTTVPTSTWLSEPVVGARHALSGIFGPLDILSADFDNDGDIDVFTSNITGSEVSYYENTGSDVFVDHSQSFAFSAALRTLETADLNGDGLLDIVAGGISTSAIDVLFQTTPGNFSLSQIPMTGGSEHVEIADFNGDGRLDILAADTDVSLLLNTGDGNFSISVVDSVNASPRGLAVGDIDGDGDIDAVASQTFEIVLYRNNGSGQFAVINDFITPTEIVNKLRVFDFDRDGRLDVIGGRFILGETLWFGNNGTTFTEHTTNIPGGQDDLTLGDINGDGFTDVLTAMVLDGADIYVNSGDNLTFQHVNIHDDLSQTVDAVDIDGDGDLDFVTEEGNHIVWYENDSVPSAPIEISTASTAPENAGTTSGTVLRPAGISNANAVQVNLQSSDPSAASVPGSVIINAGSNSSAFVITIPDDAVTDGDKTVTITASASGLTSGASMITIVDNESPGITVSSTAGSTIATENGVGDLVNVTLAAEPQTDVTITVLNGDLTQMSVDTTTLTFTQANWSVAQPVTITAVDDTVADGSATVLLTFQVDDAASDAAYANVQDVQHSVTVADDETAGIVVDLTAVAVSENGTTVNAQVTLSAEPTGTVTVLIDSDDVTEVNVSASTLTFTAANWNTPQPLMITGVDDIFVDGTTNTNVTLSVDADLSEDAYDGAASVVLPVTNDDNDTAGLLLTEAAVTVGEDGTTATFDAVLTAAPTTSVVLDIASSDVTASTVSPMQLTFTSANWNQAQTVLVRGTDDFFADADQVSQVVVTVNADLSDDPFDSAAGRSVAVTTINDDVVGMTVSTNTLTLSEADTVASVVDVRLTSQPSGDVVIAVVNSDSTETLVEPSTLTFTPQNWQTLQSVSVTAINDPNVDGDQQSTITLTVDADASDDAFDNLPDRIVAVTTADDDVAGLTIDRSSAVLSEDGNSVDVAVSLTAAPVVDTAINVTSSAPDEAVVSVSALTFNADNWNVSQTVTISGVDDQLLDGAMIAIVTFSVDAAAVDAAFVNVADRTVSVTIKDNDVAAIVLSKQTASVTEDGSFDFVDVSLNVSPATPVAVMATRRTSGEVLESPNLLIFSAANWNVPQRITLTGVDDAVVDGDQTTIVDVGVVPAQSNDAFDSLSNQSIVVTTADNDAANILPTVIGPVGRIGDGAPEISWQPVTGAKTYDLWLEDLDGDGTPVLNPTISETTFQVPNDLPIGRYRAWVLANFGDGTRSAWTAERFTVVTAPQIVVPDFHATDLTPTISWSSAPGTVQHRIFISNATKDITLYDTVVSGNEFTVPEDLGFGRHHVWVRAIGTSGIASEWSQRQTLYVGPNLIGPTGSTFDSTPAFQWTQMADIANYQLHVRRRGVVVLDVPSGITATGYTPDSSLPDGDYRWWIRPSTADGQLGAWSPAGEFNIGGRTTVTSATASGNADTTLIKWDAVGDATEYEVFIGDRNGVVSRVAGITNSQYTHPTPLADGNYKVWVRSFASDSRASVWSRPLDFTVQAATTVVVASPKAAVEPTFERPARLQWTTTENAVSVDIVYESAGTLVRHNAVTGNDLTLPAAITTGQVRWWVKANTTDGAGSWSRQSVLELDSRPIVSLGVDLEGRRSVVWTPVTSAARYILHIERLDIDNDNVALRLDDLVSTRLDVSTLPAGPYRAWVLAISADGQRSRWSSPVDFISPTNSLT